MLLSFPLIISENKYGLIYFPKAAKETPCVTHMNVHLLAREIFSGFPVARSEYFMYVFLFSVFTCLKSYGERTEEKSKENQFDSEKERYFIVL